MSPPPDEIAPSVASSIVATETGTSCRFSSRRLAVTVMLWISSGLAAASVESCVAESVSPVACAAAGDAASVAVRVASATARSETVLATRRIG